MKKRILVTLIAVLLCVALFTGCSNDDGIVGTWACTDDSQPHDWYCGFTFQADGRFVDRDGDWGTYSIDGDTITFAFDTFAPVTLNFRLSGNRLTLTADGLHIVLNRQ